MVVDDEDCPECDEILEELEMIDDEADLYGELKITLKLYFSFLIYILIDATHRKTKCFSK